MRSACFLKLFLILSGTFLSMSVRSQVIDLTMYQIPFHAEGISIFHLNADSLFPEKQNIFLAMVNNHGSSRYSPRIAYSDSALKPTSRFAKESNAILALNGSFFDVDKGGSVAYLESENKVISFNREAKQKWAKSDSLLNGAILVKKSGKIIIEIAKESKFYMKSRREKAVLISGPILLSKGKELPLENSAFVKKRHPRSCLCETEDGNLLLIAIDGRSEIASGMSLRETQQLLLRLNCRNAINLDGGGSTTLWVNDGQTNGILNKPSDKEGERPVSNAIIITKKQGL